MTTQSPTESTSQSSTQADETLPDYPDEVACWGPVDTACREGWSGFDQAVRDRAVALAVTSLRALTGYRVGGCPVVVRPCLTRCVTNAYEQYDQTVVSGPYVLNGGWYNACGCVADCACGQLCEVRLPGMVGDVVSVAIDGNELPEGTVWRVDDGRRLVRVDGECWPICQDMAAPPGGLGSFEVTIQAGMPVDRMGALAAGLLAHEFALACTGMQCRLPSNVESVTRGTTTYRLAADQFDKGLTGIREVDVWIRRINPHQLTAPPMVWSPDVTRPRRVR